MNNTDQFSNVQIVGFMSLLAFLFCLWTNVIFDVEIRQTKNGLFMTFYGIVAP